MRADQPDILSVSQLTRRIKTLLETELAYVWVSGEVSNWRVSPAGHAYFTLKDENSQIDGVMFRGKLSRTPAMPDNGMEVVAYGLITVYEKRGNYQLLCEEIHPKGVGALQLAFDRLRKKLAEEGLFDEAHKKPLPLLPRRIGIVTSPTGAAIQDILNVIGRRFANVHILLYPARVQGEEAAREIVAGIRALDAFGVDVMIVGRGGGSLEDLWPFNEEIVVRAVYDAKTPIISAVGHEIDFTLSDFAADMRAPTPSAAAELVVKEHEALAQKVRQLQAGLCKCALRAVEQRRNRLALMTSSYVFRRPEEVVRQRRQRVDEMRMQLESALRDRASARRVKLDRMRQALAYLSPARSVRQAIDRLAGLRLNLSRCGLGAVEQRRARLRPVLAQLDALSPLAVLSRGYAVVRKTPEGELVRDVAQLAQGDRLAMRFGRGSAGAVVETIEEPRDGGNEL